jgi:hypothetical protein
MKQLDVKKIFDQNPEKTESLLLSAIIIMQFVIENPDDLETNQRSMQKFVDQFTKS